MTHRSLKDLLRGLPGKGRAKTKMTDANVVPFAEIEHTDEEVKEGQRLADLILTLTPEPINLSSDKLLIDYSYQPDLYKARVAEIVDHWNPLQYRPGVLNEREDGTLAVVDGQHSLTAGRIKGIPVLTFTVLRDENRLSVKKEAWLLRELNARKNRRAPSKLAELRAEMKEGTDIGKTYKKITVILNRVGFHIGGLPKGRVDSLDMLVESFNLDGTGEALERALWIIKRAWQGTGAKGVMIRAISGLCDNVGDLIDEGDMSVDLGKLSQSGKGLDTWTQAVKAEFGTKPTCRYMPYALAERVLYAYNFRRKGKKLPEIKALDGFKKLVIDASYKQAA